MPRIAFSTNGTAAANEPRLTSSKKFSALLVRVAEWATVLMVILVPLFFLPTTSQSLEFPKQMLLMVGVTVALLAWIGAFISDRAVVLRRSVANLIVALFVVSLAISAFLSGARYVGTIGDYGQEYQSLVTTILFAILFFIIVNLPDKKGLIGKFLFSTIVVGGVVSLYALLQFSGLHVLPFVENNNFNLIGSTVVLGLYAAVVVALTSVYFLMDVEGKRSIAKRLVAAVAGLCAFILVLAIDFWLIWTTIIVGLIAALVCIIVRPDIVRRLTWLAVPMGVIIVSIFMLFVNLPSFVKAPTEVFPTFAASFEVAKNALASNPVFGTGPGTFAQDYALYRGTEFNKSSLWYLRFDRGTSYPLTAAATLGFAGLVTWLAIIVIGIWKAAAFLFSGKKRDASEWISALVISVAWLTSAAGLTLYAASLSSLFIFWVLFALLIRVTAENTVALRFETSPRTALGMTFGLVITVVLALTGWFVMGTRFVADTAFASAVTRDTRTQLDKAVSELESARKFNSFSDLIARNLSQAYFLKIQNVVADTKTDQQTRANQVLTLTDGAVGVARAATALSPTDAANWSQLGQIYESIASYVNNAADEAVKALEQAAKLDPTSPAYPTELGKVYILMADLASAEAQNAKSEDLKADANKRSADALTRANASLEKALNLKSDYTPAGFQMALVLDRQGKIKDAIKKLESIQAQVPTDVGVAMQLGLLYYRDEQKDKAQAELELAVKLLPTFANARWYLSMIYEENGQYDQAIAQVQEILKTAPDNLDAQNRLADLNAKKNGAAPSPTGSLEPLPENQETQNQPTIGGQ